MKVLLSASLAVASIAMVDLASAERRATDSTVAEGVDTTQPPDSVSGTEVFVIETDVVVEDTEVAVEDTVDLATAPSPDTLDDDDLLVRALLTVEDLGPEWETEGPETLVYGPTAEPFTFCPNGDELLVPIAQAVISFTPSEAAESNSLSDDEVAEGTFRFASAQEAGSWIDGFESCVGEEWEESSDPVEHVTLERLETPDFGDQSAGFHTVYAHSEGPEHDTHGVVVRLGEVLVILDYNNGGLDEPIDQSFFDGLIVTAVANVRASLE